MQKSAISQAITNYRKENSLSVQGFADLLGTSRQQIHQWERNDRTPTYKSICLLAKILSPQVILNCIHDDHPAN